MRPGDFDSAARALARPCTLLREHGTTFAALWGGDGVLPARAGHLRHWLSIDGMFLPEHLRHAGVASIFSDESDGTSGAVVWSPEARLPRNTTGGVPLFAWPASSLPPVQAVFALGGGAVTKWLSELGWRGTEYNPNFPQPEVVEPYEETFQASCPLYTETAHAVLGGWHFPWPDGHWADLTDATLMAWTIADSEPWVEAWARGDSRWVVQRVT